MIPQTLTNMNFFVGGKGYAGLVTGVNPPKLTRKPEEHRAECSQNPTLINNVRVDKLVMRAPKMGDVRIAQKRAAGDREQEEILLFTSLLDCSPTDMEGLSVRDDHRVQEACFRFISEDADDEGNAPAGKKAGE